MKAKSLIPQVLAAMVGLLFLGGLGIYWPAFVGANSAKAPVAPAATTGDAITYQGYLTDENEVPLDGTFTMRFIFFNDSVAGATRWDSGDINVTVSDGLFDVRLAIADDIFNGEALWVSQIVNGETLTPRQEILPTAIAHTLRPGAVIKGTANAISNGYLLDVQMNNDAFSFNRGAIYGETTTGNAIYGVAENGRAVYGRTADGIAVYGFDGGDTAAKGYGGYFYSTNGVGVYGYSGADRTAQNLFAPGIYGESDKGVGVYGRGDTSDSYTFYNEGGYFLGGKGLYARGTDPSGQAGYGARIYSDHYRGMYVRGSAAYYDAYFGGGGGIYTNSIVTAAAATSALVVNLGSTPIEPGDLVAMVGISNSRASGEPMLGVAKVDVSNRNAVIGVAKEAILAQTISFDDGHTYLDFSPTDGAIAPNGYLVIITDGLAPAVNVSSLALVADGAIGEKIAISVGGDMRLAADGSDNMVVVGRVAGSVDEENNTVPMFIDID